jgi:hypothetical protein
MLRKLLATVLAMALPSVAAAGPLREAAEKAAQEQATAQARESRRGSRFWTGVALVGGGAALSIATVGFDDDDDEDDDAEDADDSDDGEDSDAAGVAALAGGLAAVGIGTVLLLTGRGAAAPSVTVGRGGFTVRKTVRF